MRQLTETVHRGGRGCPKLCGCNVLRGPPRSSVCEGECMHRLWGHRDEEERGSASWAYDIR